jgi:hypothetical protein
MEKQRGKRIKAALIEQKRAFVFAILMDELLQGRSALGMVAVEEKSRR